MTIVDFGLAADIGCLDNAEREQEKEKDRHSLMSLKRAYLYPMSEEGRPSTETSSSIGINSEADDMFDFDGSPDDMRVDSSAAFGLKKVAKQLNLLSLGRADIIRGW